MSLWFVLNLVQRDVCVAAVPKAVMAARFGASDFQPANRARES
jgi:hypothetical protein